MIVSLFFYDRICWKFTSFHLVLNQDLQDFQDYRGRLRFEGNGYL